MSYTKICKICKKTFESDSKNKLYCSDKCAKRGAKKSYRARKMKHIRSNEYTTDKEIAKVINKAHTFAREIAEKFRAKVCTCTDEGHICSNELVVHHIDHDPFNNNPSNLRWLCTKAHAELHAKEKDCNSLNELKSYITIKKIESETPIDQWENLIANNTYADAINNIFEQLDIRCYNSELQRKRQLDTLCDEDYEAVTGEKRPKPTLTLID